MHTKPEAPNGLAIVVTEGTTIAVVYDSFDCSLHVSLDGIPFSACSREEKQHCFDTANVTAHKLRVLLAESFNVDAENIGEAYTDCYNHMKRYM